MDRGGKTMSQILEIPDGVYDALKRAAEAGGTTPVQWIEARLAEKDVQVAEPPTDGPARTLADRFAGRIGRIRSGMTESISERVGDDFAEYLEEKRRRGCL
jgi:hypothetical protein